MAADAVGEGTALVVATGDADIFGEGATELRTVGEECGEASSNGVGEAAAMGVTGFGVPFGVLVAPPKKCASTPPSSNPAKITITTSGNNGSPPPPPESSSERRRRGESLT